MRGLAPVGEVQLGIGENRDTIYSLGVFDLTEPVTITKPDTGGRYQSMLVQNEDQYLKLSTTAPGEYTITQERAGTRYIGVDFRTFIDPNNMMRDQVARLRRLAIDVREASALEEHALTLHVETVDPGDQVRTAVQFARPSYQAKGVELTHASDGVVPLIRVDPARIQQVLGNLLANALRHTRPGGHVAVSTAGAGTRVEIAVADDGEGIPGDQLEAVFDRFHRIDPSRASHDGSGSGLGLTIARGIIAGHGGTLTAASDGPGAGSTFTIRLPAAT